MTFNSSLIIKIHESLAIDFKLEPGFRDKKLIDSIIQKIDEQISGQEIYPDLYSKAASLFEGIIRLHPFIDGNKRTALASVQEYLFEKEVIFLIPLSAPRFAVTVAKQIRPDQDYVESLIASIIMWIKHRCANFDNIQRLLDLSKSDIILFEKIREIAKNRNDSKLLTNTIFYMLATEIYPGLDTKPDDILKFFRDRMERIQKFYENKSRNFK